MILPSIRRPLTIEPCRYADRMPDLTVQWLFLRLATLLGLQPHKPPLSPAPFRDVPEPLRQALYRPYHRRHTTRRNARRIRRP